MYHIQYRYTIFHHLGLNIFKEPFPSKADLQLVDSILSATVIPTGGFPMCFSTSLISDNFETPSQTLKEGFPKMGVPPGFHPF